MKLELIFDSDCPNVDATRTVLREALTELGLPARWSEWNRADPRAPARARDYGSPTVLLDGRDVAAQAPGSQGASCCRVYEDGDGRLGGVPARSTVLDALRAAAQGRPARRRALASLPAVGVAFLPGVACPACWPLYAGALSSLGLGFLLDTTTLAWLKAAFLLLAVAALAHRARARRGFGPFWLGTLAALVILGGKFALETDGLAYAGVGVLVAASLWNAWPRRQRAQGGCGRCAAASEPTFQGAKS